MRAHAPCECAHARVSLYESIGPYITIHERVTGNALFFFSGLKSLCDLLGLELVPQLLGVVDKRDILEVNRVGNAKASHAMGVSPLFEVLLKVLGSAVPVASVMVS